MYKAGATYRIQFHKGFTFSDLTPLVPYLAKLGTTAIYASPIFEAIPGSTHGYDVTCPHVINPEIGTEEELIGLSTQLKIHGIGWIQDIVPNHMAFHPKNAWLMDVLANWDKSPYFHFFDINFITKQTDQRLMVPFLSETLAEAITAGKLEIKAKKNQFFIAYGEQLWPLNETSKALLAIDKYFNDDHTLHEHLLALSADQNLLKSLLDQQYYRLCCWKETSAQINYRRFFTVNALICMNMANEKVFEVYHRYIKELVQRGIFQGLRVDHVDGLADPKTYVERLRAMAGENVYIVVEKILESEEVFPTDWPVQGTTGYEFLAVVNNLMTNQSAETHFDNLYQKHIGKSLNVDDLAYDKKRAILFNHMVGELDHLNALFLQLELASAKELAHVSNDELKAAIGEFLVYCPVYRYYLDTAPISKVQFTQLQAVLKQAAKQSGNAEAFRLISNALQLLKRDDNQAIKALQFFQRCMQFSGPLMAKGIEDTLMYTYHRFIGHGEVGDAPAAFGISIAHFHQLMQERKALMPIGMNATATHDTKKGEDTRARLNVLSDIPKDWAKLVSELSTQLLDGEDENIHKNDAYMLFQALVGAFPLINDDQQMDDRIVGFVEKALRESKKRSNWEQPDDVYEERAKELALSLLNKQTEAYQLLLKFTQKLSPFATINSLVQQLLKFTCPGIPDVYQGTELLDFSLVDPDNRRPVDYAKREGLLASLSETDSLQTLWAEQNPDKLKFWVVHQLLKFRNQHKDLFDLGEYLPLTVKGTYSKHLIAFARHYKGKWIIVAAGLGMAKCCNEENAQIQSFDWKDTLIELPNASALSWQNFFNAAKIKTLHAPFQLLAKDIFNGLPLAIVESSQNESYRGGGILMPIFSLPASHGIGEIGKEAYKFVDNLCTAGQKFWQLLPLNPVTSDQCYSPYSAASAMAGNPLLISLDWLCDRGLLTNQELENTLIPSSNKVDYPAALKIKEHLLAIAYQRHLNHPAILGDFNTFCKVNACWLNDYALYQSLKNHHQQKPWHQWEKKYSLRNEEALERFATRHASELQKIKWQQFVFDLQWGELKTYANHKGIQFIGDLPFYVGFDSAEVWANPKLFKLNEQRQMKVVAGVPPDVLSEDGQLWGMPIFDWEGNKDAVFTWWKQRIAANLAFFDLLRFDHFRAIHSYWEVPAGHDNARGGKWMIGPAEAFLQMICTTFKKEHFLVEDLGGDMDGPIALRNDFALTGMKVLQFGFGEDMVESPHLPHQYNTANFVVYPGTHDNNTIRGWYENELSEHGKARLALYVGSKVSATNVHQHLIRLALASNAKIAIIQMQDVLGLPADGRMNTPGTIVGNWTWKLNKWPSAKVFNALAETSWLFGRI